MTRAEYERTPRRRAYKRMWRNWKNYQRAVDQLEKYDEQADRSLKLVIQAMNDMRAEKV